MIDELKTLEQFGYTSDSLSYSSNKKVIVICNVCGKERILKFQKYTNLCRSCSHKGKKFSEEHKRKLSKAHMGKRFSEKTIQKMRGRKHSEEAKQKMSINSPNRSGKNNPMFGIHNYGESNPNWQGGISFGKYCFKFNKKIKEQIREEFHRQCFLCGKNETECKTKLSVHHVDHNKSQGCNGDWKLVPLCDSCHPKISGKYVRDYYEDLISRLLHIREMVLEYENKISYRSII